jgi:hypothetical protein
MKLELDSKSEGRVRIGDIVTVRRVVAYARDRDYQNGRYATIHRTSLLSFDTGNGALDHHEGERAVKRVINDGTAVIV